MQITISDLNFSYDRGSHALAGVNLTIDDGLFVLLGANASGKTTLIRVLATLLRPTGGTVDVGGLDLAKHRDRVRAMTGFLPQRFDSFRRMTTWEFLDYSARLAGLRKKRDRDNEVHGLMDALGLTPVKDEFADGISTVMQRHLEIAQAVIGKPRIILLDEPTVGLSTQERIRFVNLLFEWTSRAENIIFSTHILSDITSACNGAAILEKGVVSWQGLPSEMPEPVGVAKK